LAVSPAKPAAAAFVLEAGFEKGGSEFPIA